MKTVLAFILTIGISFSASAIGHPHNLFAAHQKAKHGVAKATIGRATSSTPLKRVFTSYAKAAAPSVFTFGWEIIKKGVL
ncbi:hypothetical protein [Tellurirhabdus bombi]|jgi:hypothetical protein|uniref:hypothetical protein n=1 Tax=Tellurirhabdus bombi TaxID=2907205 RepID=UPI001F3B2ED4|nr:hypothetical protein [Tellurirhabdus bombi]